MPVPYQQCAHNLDSPDEHVDGECHNISIPPKLYFLQIVLPGHDGVPPTHNRLYKIRKISFIFASKTYRT